MLELDDPIKLFANLREHFESGNYKKVIELGEEGIQRYDDFPLLFLLLAKSYLQLGDLKNTQRILEIGLERFPFNRMLVQFWEEFRNNFLQENSSISSNQILFPFSSNVKKIFNNRLENFNF